jgi:glutathionylspermidine synthase
LWNCSHHPNLLPAYFDAWRISGNHVKKPLYSREGENISIYADGEVLHTTGEYGAEGMSSGICAATKIDDGITPAYTSIGAWVVGDEAAGIGIRKANINHQKHQPFHPSLLYRLTP